MKKNKLSLLVFAAFAAVPLLAQASDSEQASSTFQVPQSGPILLQDNAAFKPVTISNDQVLGYIGTTSKNAITASNYATLTGPEVDRNFFETSNTLEARVRFWHRRALDTVAIDHSPEPGEEVEQGGPTRASRALAIVQIAVFDALNGVLGGATSFNGLIQGFPDASADIAVAFASAGALSELYPNQTKSIRQFLLEDLERIRPTVSEEAIRQGQQVAAISVQRAIGTRVGDGSEIPEVSFGEGGRVATGDVAVFGRRINSGSTEFGDWTPDPNTPATSPEATLALGASWGAVKPFVLNSGAQFRPALPAPFDAPNGNGLDRYIDSLLNVATMGGSPDNTGILSTSTEEFRFVGNFWGYDGVPLIGVPPRLYNQIAVQLTEGRVSDPLEVARILALINVGLADAGIAAWDAKYFYNFWRPVTAVRAPTTLSPLIPRDENWDPVGVSVVNTDLAIRPSPPFPAYPSGHATFGATTFEILRDFFGDNTPFTFVSDEFNGEGFDPLTGLPRPLVPVRFSTLTEAQEENGISRIYNGSHWDFDDTVGQAMGVSVARFLLDNSQVLKRL